MREELSKLFNLFSWSPAVVISQQHSIFSKASRMANPPIPRFSLDQIPTSFATVFGGTPNDPLELKLKAISLVGFRVIELGFPDLLSFAGSHVKKDIKDRDFKSLCEAGKEVKALCKKIKLGVMTYNHSQISKAGLKGVKRR